MWYPAALAVIIGLCLFIGRIRGPKTWLGSPRTAPSDRPYLWDHEPKRKRHPAASRIGISARPPFIFKLEKQRATHAISRLLGFCTELETGHAPRIFIQSDDLSLLKTLQASPETQALITQAFARGVRTISATTGHLIARLDQSPANPPQQDADAILDALLALKSLIAAIPPLPPAHKRLQRLIAHGFKRLPVILLVTTFTTLTLNLVLGYQVIQWEPLLPLLAQCTAAYVLAGLAILLILFRDSSYGHEVFIHFLRMSIWSFVLCAIVMIWFINCQYDTAAPEIRNETVLEKFIYQTRKNKNFNVRVADWTSQKQTINVQISETLYNKLHPGEPVRILSRAGRLHMQWIAKVEQIKND